MGRMRLDDYSSKGLEERIAELANDYRAKAIEAKQALPGLRIDQLAEAAAEAEVADHTANRIEALAERMAAPVYPLDATAPFAATVDFINNVRSYTLHGPDDGWSGNGIRNAVTRMKHKADLEMLEELTKGFITVAGKRLNEVEIAKTTYQLAEMRADYEAQKAARKEQERLAVEGAYEKDGKTVSTAAVNKVVREVVPAEYLQKRLYKRGAFGVEVHGRGKYDRHITIDINTGVAYVAPAEREAVEAERRAKADEWMKGIVAGLEAKGIKATVSDKSIVTYKLTVTGWAV